MKIYTIGFTQSSAEHFFGRLRGAGTGRVLDVRLNNTSQLAGFAKRDDLEFFLRAICGIPYFHLPELAPTQAMLDALKKNKGGWEEYEAVFKGLMESRGIAARADRALFDGGCLLCSEAEPEHCHRRLVAEHLRDRWGGVEIVHL